MLTKVRLDVILDFNLVATVDQMPLKAPESNITNEIHLSVDLRRWDPTQGVRSGERQVSVSFPVKSASQQLRVTAPLGSPSREQTVGAPRRSEARAHTVSK